MDGKEDSNSVNEEELMQYYGFTGNFGKFQLKTKHKAIDRGENWRW